MQLELKQQTTIKHTAHLVCLVQLQGLAEGDGKVLAVTRHRHGTSDVVLQPQIGWHLQE
jgi:hypothetical protein